MLFIAVTYCLVGIVFAAPGTYARAWRLAAWVVSAAAYAAHIGYEHLRLRNAPIWLALHAALAVAVGALALAVAAMIHRSLAGVATSQSRLLAFVLWPLITGIPAFLVALGVGALLARASHSMNQK
jgi:hypothetical protein